MPLAVYYVTSTPVGRQRKSKMPLEDSDEGSRGTHPRRSERYQSLKRHGEKDYPPQHDRTKEKEYTPKRRHSDRHKGPFTIRITEYSIPHAFTKPQN